MMAFFVYLLCVLSATVCGVLLFRGYATTRTRLLLWSAIAFSGLALNNILLVVDVRLGSATDLSIVRTIPALAGMGVLLFGLIWETR